MKAFERLTHKMPSLLMEATVLLIISLLALAGCTTAPPAPPTAEIPVAVPIDCHYPDPGPKPDLSAAAALTKTSTPQQVLTAMSAALAALAEDDARLRALMNHGR